MDVPDVLGVTMRVAHALEAIGVPYRIGGSLASSAFGIARATLDADLVADLKPEHIEPLVSRLQGEFYISPEAVRQAVQRRSSFNLIHLASMFKVDVFVLKPRPFDRQAFARGVRRTVDEAGTFEAFFTTPEDIVLHKLEWYRQGGEVSERQWQDVLGVLKVQGDQLDRAHLQRWAGELGVTALLAKAFEEAGLR